MLETIATYAFKTTDYPLILSFENHCNPKQQAKIAKYCEEYFGDMMLQVKILKKDIDNCVIFRYIAIESKRCLAQSFFQS